MGDPPTERAIDKTMEPDIDPAHQRWSRSAGGEIGCSWSVAVNDGSIEYCTAKAALAWLDRERVWMAGWCADHEKAMRPPVGTISDGRPRWALLTFDGCPGDVLEDARAHEIAIRPTTCGVDGCDRDGVDEGPDGRMVCWAHKKEVLADGHELCAFRDCASPAVTVDGTAGDYRLACREHRRP